MLLANSGSPLMMLGMLQLLGGNLLIAALEACIVRWVFRPQRTYLRVFGIMVFGNYVSFIAGMFLFSMMGTVVLESLNGEEALYNLPRLLTFLFVASFLLTLAMEFPFCLWAVGPRKTRKRRVLVGLTATLVSQTVSYLAMLPLVLGASGFSAATEVTPDRSLVSQAPDIATIYYLSNDNRSLCKIRLNGTGREKVKDLARDQDQHGYRNLYLSRPDEQTRWSLKCDEDVLLPDVAGSGGLAWTQAYEKGTAYHYFYHAAGLEHWEDRAWDVRAGLYGIEGIRAYHRKTGQDIHVALETPFASWWPNNPSLLPGELVVFEFGRQIVLLDLNRRKIGLIALGRQPVVVLDDAVVPATQPK